MPISTRIPRIPQRRHFVSTLLLSRTWETETVVDLRKEAKARGLSTKGNKSTLIARIKEHEENNVTSIPPPRTARSASTIVPPPATSPGIPFTARSTRSDFLAVKLPDLSQPPPRTPVQIPYVPDFWDSARPGTPLEPVLPKLHVVGGSATHYSGGPTYRLEKHNEDDLPSVTDRPPGEEVGLSAEFWQNLGLSGSFSARRTLSEASAAQDESRTYSRPLTDKERNGLYILLGIIGGSWLVGGFMN